MERLKHLQNLYNKYLEDNNHTARFIFKSKTTIPTGIKCLRRIEVEIHRIESGKSLLVCSFECKGNESDIYIKAEQELFNYLMR